MYKGDVGLWINSVDNAALEAFVKRGGGIVSFHDSLCGPDPEYFANTYTGGAKKHGEVNYTLDAKIPYTVVDKASPIMKDFPDMTLADDEAFEQMTWAKDPAIHVLATAVIADTPSAHIHAGEVVPQLWTWEHTLITWRPACPRNFALWMQGHILCQFHRPPYRADVSCAVSRGPRRSRWMSWWRLYASGGWSRRTGWILRGRGGSGGSGWWWPRWNCAGQRTVSQDRRGDLRACGHDCDKQKLRRPKQGCRSFF